MKSILVLIALFTTNVFATSDAVTSTWIVVANAQDEELFTVEKALMMGCYGLPQGPQLDQFTAEYIVSASRGCGDVSGNATWNMNALSCGKVESSERSVDEASITKLVLNISQCPSKENKQFVTMIRTAAARNFPQYKNGKINKKKEVELVIIK